MPATTSTTTVTASRKRKLTEDLDLTPVQRHFKRPRPLIAATLSTRNAQGSIDKLHIKVDQPLIIGRHFSSDYVVHDRSVSNKHCTIYAVVADTGNITIVCQDSSRNGIIVNGNSFHGRSILLMDGDELVLGDARVFKCENFSIQALATQTQSTQVPAQTVGQYLITSRKLGSGAYSSVRLAIDRTAHRQAACKTIVRKTQADIADVLKEVGLLKKLNHPNISAIYDSESSGEHLHIFLELATGGDLFSYLAKNGTLCEGEAKFISYQLMKGLEYIHGKGMAHRDLKPENVLLATPGQYPRVLIADFGLARERAVEPTGNVAGTVSYLPPEAITAITLKNKYSTEMGDSWALGVIVFIMLQGFHLFDPHRALTQISLYPVDNLGQKVVATHSEELVRRRIVQKRALFSHGDWEGIELGMLNYFMPIPYTCHVIKHADRGVFMSNNATSGLDTAQDLISKLLVQDVKKRQTTREALQHRWIKVDEISLSKAHKKVVNQR